MFTPFLQGTARHFSEMIDRVLSRRPQTITRKGKVPATEWERRSMHRDNLAEFFSRSPLAGSELPIDRPRDDRQVNL
jgi:hypothetical protein